MKSKKGAVNWTVGKLLSLILFVIVLVLVVYGLVTGGLNPLIDKMSGKIDEVLILLGFSKDSSNCYSESLVSVSNGNSLLDSLNVSKNERKGIALSVCRDLNCSISGGGLDYSVINGVLKKNNRDIRYTFLEDPEDARFNWEIYNAVAGIFWKKGVTTFYSEKRTKKFMFETKAKGLRGKDLIAVWENGFWELKEKDGESLMYPTNDDEEFFRIFYSIVTNWIDDEVYWNDSDHPRPKPIDTLIYKRGSEEYTRSYQKGQLYSIDGEEELNLIKSKFKEKKREFLEEIKPSDEEVDSFREAINGESFLIGDEKFFLYLDDSINPPSIKVESDRRAFLLKFEPNSLKRSTHKFLKEEGTLEDVALVDYPLVLLKWNPEKKEWESAGRETDYKLPKKYFDEAYRATAVYDFLLKKCR